MTEHDRQQIRERFLALNTATICDVYDELEWPVTALDNGIVRRTEGAKWWPVGPTHRGRMVNEKGADRLKLQVVDELPAVA